MSRSNSIVTLGVVAISCNEERDLPGFLENLLPWVDEIIIVDDGSTDGTRKIAETAGEKVRVIVSPRVEGEYYADQRNKGIGIASSDWLLHMDIDERISPNFALEILEAIHNPDYDAYRYRRLNYFLHRPMRGGDWRDWNLVHLSRREYLRFSGMYHEKIEIAVPPKRVGQLRNFMLHLNDESYGERLRKSAVYQVEVSENIKRANTSLGYFDILGSFIREFINQYFWKRGFLDGVTGLVWAFHAASAQNRAYILAWDQQNRIPREKLEEEIRLMWHQHDTQEAFRKKVFRQDGE
jgi:glycosyltransferase involved in cell wall biosynthesis